MFEMYKRNITLIETDEALNEIDKNDAIINYLLKQARQAHNANYPNAPLEWALHQKRFKIANRLIKSGLFDVTLDNHRLILGAASGYFEQQAFMLLADYYQRHNMLIMLEELFINYANNQSLQSVENVYHTGKNGLVLLQVFKEQSARDLSATVLLFSLTYNNILPREIVQAILVFYDASSKSNPVKEAEVEEIVRPTLSCLLS